MSSSKPGKQERKPFLSVTLKDCDVQHFRAGGKGGQNQNKRDTGTRIIHRASGAVGEARDERSQLQNIKLAFRRMAAHPKFKIWLNRQLWFGGELPESRVRRDMESANLRVEGRRNGQWIPIEETTDDERQ